MEEEVEEAEEEEEEGGSGINIPLVDRVRVWGGG